MTINEWMILSKRMNEKNQAHETMWQVSWFCNCINILLSQTNKKIGQENSIFQPAQQKWRKWIVIAHAPKITKISLHMRDPIDISIQCIVCLIFLLSMDFKPIVAVRNLFDARSILDELFFNQIVFN